MSGIENTVNCAGMADALRSQIDARLSELVSESNDAPERLEQSMRHSLLAPGKRVRAVLALLSAEHHGGQAEKALTPACAVEMVHSASLVLDDLPAMDDSSLRRGLPANHCIFGEGTAILAAIGLMNHAFGVVSGDRSNDDAARIAIVDVLSWSIGEDGLIAGQEEDLHGAESLSDVGAIERMHGRKTGALFAAAVEIGAIVAGVDGAARRRARDFGWQIGVAFQTFDDLLDRYASSDAALKDTGKDAAKPTVVSLIGSERALDGARRHLADAVSLFSPETRNSSLVAYVDGLGGELMSRLKAQDLEPADGVSGR